MAVNTDHERRSYIFVNCDNALRLLRNDNNEAAMKLLGSIRIQFETIEAKIDNDYRLMGQFASQFVIKAITVNEIDGGPLLDFALLCYQNITTKTNDDYREFIKNIYSQAGYKFNKKEFDAAKKISEQGLNLFKEIVVNEPGDDKLRYKMIFLIHDIDTALLKSEIVNLKETLAQNKQITCEIQQQNYQQAIDQVQGAMFKFSEQHGFFCKREQDTEHSTLKFNLS